MTPPHWRLVSMWEGDPVGVDPRRPLIGFALVAVLCALLMTLSVGRGWSKDLFHPGKPIAGSVLGGHGTTAYDRADRPTEAAEPAPVSIPAELSAQPLGVAAAKPATGSATTFAGDRSSDADRSARRDQRKADRAAARDQRKAERAAEQDATEATRQAEHDAAKAARD